MRHLTSTSFAALEVPEHDRNLFYKHMGHSAEMNAKVYQCPPGLQEVTVVGKFLGDLDARLGNTLTKEPLNIISKL